MMDRVIIINQTQLATHTLIVRACLWSLHGRFGLRAHSLSTTSQDRTLSVCVCVRHVASTIRP